MAKRKICLFKEQFSLALYYTPKTDLCQILRPTSCSQF